MADEKKEKPSETNEKQAADKKPVADAPAEVKVEADPIADLDDDLAEAMGEDASADSAEGEDADVDIDQIIAEVDPEFEKELSDINAADFDKADIKTDASVAEDLDQEKVPSAFRSFLKNLPKEVKTRYMVAVTILLIMIPIAGVIFSGYLLPTFKLPYVVSMLELTDKIYTYPTDTIYVPLFDDFRSNAVTYPLPKTTITLKRTGEGTSYGNFEFFLSLRDKDLVPQIELKQSEIIDLIQRTLEEVTWRELQTPTGKERVKKVIRHRVNEHLQGNLILGVYYRSVVLQK